MTVLELRNDPTQPSRYVDMLTDEQCNELQAMCDKYDMKCKPTKLTKEQVGAARKARQRWQEYTQGNAYMLHLNPLTYYRREPYRQVAYGNSAEEAVANYYRGLEGNSPKQLLCNECVAVYALDNPHAMEGELLWELEPWESQA